jgi:hypothetical protein
MSRAIKRPVYAGLFLFFRNGVGLQACGNDTPLR